MPCSFVAKEISGLIGYSINTLYDKPRGVRDLDPLGNHKHPRASHAGVYIGFCGNVNPKDPSVLSYNLYLSITYTNG